MVSKSVSQQVSQSVSQSVSQQVSQLFNGPDSQLTSLISQQSRYSISKSTTLVGQSISRSFNTSASHYEPCSQLSISVSQQVRYSVSQSTNLLLCEGDHSPGAGGDKSNIQSASQRHQSVSQSVSQRAYSGRWRRQARYSVSKSTTSVS